MTTPAKPLPCPHCGNKDVTPWPMVGQHGKYESPLCEACGASICENIVGETTEEHLAAWNRRSSPDAEVRAGTGLSEDERLARAAVAQYGCLKYPVGSDRAALCHAAIVLNGLVDRLLAAAQGAKR